MWVEADGNLPGGEALARQLVHGQRFFIEHFGVETKGVWLPDSFGYTAAYPQLARLAGNEWFLTQKLSWNETNKLPHHTFGWEGIDGTRIFTHFPPVDTYNVELSGREMAHAVRNYQDKGARHPLARARSGTATAAAAPPARCWSAPAGCATWRARAKVGVEHPDAFFAAAREEIPNGPGVVGRALPGAAPRHLHLPGPHQAGQPPQRTPAARGRVVGDDRRPARAGRTPTRTRSSTGCGRRCCCTSSTTSCPGSSIAWVHREAEAEYARVARELEAITAEAVGALGAAGWPARASTPARTPAPRWSVTPGRGPGAARTCPGERRRAASGLGAGAPDAPRHRHGPAAIARQRPRARRHRPPTARWPPCTT